MLKISLADRVHVAFQKTHPARQRIHVAVENVNPTLQRGGGPDWWAAKVEGGLGYTLHFIEGLLAGRQLSDECINLRLRQPGRLRIRDELVNFRVHQAEIPCQRIALLS